MNIKTDKLIKMDIKAEVYKIISNVFNISENNIQDHCSSIDIKGWDSLGQLQLIQALERHFNISFDIMEIFKIITVESIIEIVKEKVE